jgi:DNA-binding NtrC family response regulator
VFPVEVPPLRERGDDVVQLARHFLDQTVKDFGREPLALTQTHAKALRAYPWPGNVRELKNVIERAVILSPGSQLRLELGTPPATGAAAPADAPGDADILDEQAMREFTRTNIVRALEASNWRVSGKGGAAELLGVRPTTLADRIKSYQIARPERR